VHCEGENAPPKSALKITVPVGIICVPDPESVTLTAHVVLDSGKTELGLQLTKTETGLSWDVEVVAGVVVVEVVVVEEADVTTLVVV
jgi:hypothetical protein